MDNVTVVHWVKSDCRYVKSPHKCLKKIILGQVLANILHWAFDTWAQKPNENDYTARHMTLSDMHL